MSNKVHTFKLPDSDVQITFVLIPELDLYIITDAQKFGRDWIQVTYFRKVYSTNLLMGVDPDDIITSISRFLAEPVIKNKLAKCDELTSVSELKLMFNISLRNNDPKNVRLIKNVFEDLLFNKL